MTEIPRRRLSEIITDSILRPFARFILAEGISDKIILRSYLKEMVPNCTIYCVDDLEIDSFLARGDGGHKGILVRVAAHLRDGGYGSFVCVVDRDFEHFHGFSKETNLIITELSDLHMYCVTITHLKGTVERVYNIENADRFVDDILSVSRTIYVARWLKEELCPGSRLVAYRRSLRIGGTGLSIDIDDLVLRQKAAAACGKEKRDIVIELEKRLGALPSDPRISISIHDLNDVTVFALKKAKSGRSVNERFVYDLALENATLENLSGEPFFMALERCIASARDVS